MEQPALQKLPIGIQSFEKLRTENYVYVDKTELIYKLIESGDYYFLSRPRRFGKSLLVSTLKAIFQGKKQLFEGLFIYERLDWEPMPVIHLDFSSISNSQEPLEESLSRELRTIAKRNGVVLEGGTIDSQFRSLIREMAGEGKVAILIDEYDKPVVDYLDDIEKARRNRLLMRDFYAVIKGLDASIGFFFLTGISKFTRISVFSDLNHLNDITFDEAYAALCGYTQQELMFYFKDYLADLAEKYSEIYPDIQEAVRMWYNGYSWTGKHFVYNPFSILSLCQKSVFRDYWFSTGTPSFLLSLFRERNYQVMDFQDLKIHESLLSSFDLETLELSVLLLQTGYLTIKDYGLANQVLTLGFPNKEVRSSFYFNLLAFLSKKGGYNTGFLIQLKQAFQDGQVDNAMELLKNLFSNIAYPLHPGKEEAIVEKEKFYHSIFYTVLKLLDFEIEVEVLTHRGRIDAVIRTDRIIYVVEFKVGDASKALEQIKEKDYASKYLHSDKEIVLLGVGFDREVRNIGSFKKQAWGQP